MHRKIVALLALAVSTAACGDPPWVGKWQVSSQWDVRGPFTPGRTVGDAVAEIVVGKMVGVAHVPSFLEDDLFGVLSSLAGGHIKTMIDTRAPAELGPEGSVTRFLSQALATVRTTSMLELDEATLSDLEGEETIQTMEFDLGTGQAKQLAMSNLFKGGEDMTAEWEGDESGERSMAIEPHYVPIQYGALLAEVLLNLLDVAGLENIKAGVLAALDCNTLVARVLDGKPGYDVVIGDWTHTIPAADFVSACQAAQTSMSGRVMGLFSSDTAVLVSGEIEWGEEDDVQITSPAGFSGILDVAPEAVAPRIHVRLTAERAR